MGMSMCAVMTIFGRCFAHALLTSTFDRPRVPAPVSVSDSAHSTPNHPPSAPIEAEGGAGAGPGAMAPAKMACGDYAIAADDFVGGVDLAAARIDLVSEMNGTLDAPYDATSR